jgi:hypothetical protein
MTSVSDNPPPIKLERDAVVKLRPIVPIVCGNPTELGGGRYITFDADRTPREQLREPEVAFR